MKQIEYLAFQIVNELLNQEFIIDDIKPSQITKIVSRMLAINLGADIAGKKTHFSKRVFFDLDGTLCGHNQFDNLVLTEDESSVTCKRCLISLKARQSGHGYTYANCLLVKDETRL